MDMRRIKERLDAITDGCLTDMHEPDNEEIKVRIVGDHLDNACGDFISLDAIVRGYQEYVVCFERVVDEKLVYDNFNLATLIALARLAVLP